MKAIVVKDDDFKTIGFEVKQGEHTLYSWGISSQLKSNFQKEVDAKVWIDEIFKLVKLQGVIEEKRNFTRQFFQVAEENGYIKKEQSVKGIKSDDEIEYLQKRIENIVNNII